jgi:hypothetical protein
MSVSMHNDDGGVWSTERGPDVLWCRYVLIAKNFLYEMAAAPRRDGRGPRSRSLQPTEGADSTLDWTESTTPATVILIP